MRDSGQIITDSMDTIDGLTMKRAQFLSKANDALEKAKALPKADKIRRLALMKQHQQYQHQANVYSGMISNMEQTAQSLDTAAVTVQLARTMKDASVQMRDQLKSVNVDDVDMVVDELDDSMRDVNEMASALSRPMGELGGMGDMVDDDELLAQLDEYDAAEVELPSAPKDPIRKKDRVPVAGNE